MAHGRARSPLLRDTFAGERHGLLVCPFAHRWILSTRTEDLRLDEIIDRFRRAFGAGRETLLCLLTILMIE